MTVLFETNRLVVRKATLADVDVLLMILSDPEQIRHFSFGEPWTRDDVVQFIRSYPDDDPHLVASPGLVLLKPTLEVIGFGGVGYYIAPGNTSDLFFILNRTHWGRGLATELAQAAIATAFTDPQVVTIYATAKPANTASVRVLEKCGFALQEYLPEKDRLLYRIQRPEVMITADNVPSRGHGAHTLGRRSPRGT